MARILVVDDSRTDILLIRQLLPTYDILSAENGQEALAILSCEQDISLMILDLNMPVMDGFQVLKAMQSHPEFQSVSTLILTNHDEIGNEIRGLELGAVDFIRKPLNMESLQKRIEIHMNLKKAQRGVEQYNRQLEERIIQRTHELADTRDMTIHALLGLLEVRNIESSNHALRTKCMMEILCGRLHRNPKFSAALTESLTQDFIDTAPLHDIGKVGIPDRILLKPGKLTPAEYDIMKLHVQYGVDALERGLMKGRTSSFIHVAIDIVGCHHERFDGTGYPIGLQGDKIPLGGRMMAVIDVYDALTNRRIYKPAMPHEEGCAVILAGSGTQFDPDVLAAFLDAAPDMWQINLTYTSSSETEEAAW